MAFVSRVGRASGEAGLHRRIRPRDAVHRRSTEGIRCQADRRERNLFSARKTQRLSRDSELDSDHRRQWAVTDVQARRSCDVWRRFRRQADTDLRKRGVSWLRFTVGLRRTQPERKADRHGAQSRTCSGSAGNSGSTRRSGCGRRWRARRARWPGRRTGPGRSRSDYFRADSGSTVCRRTGARSGADRTQSGECRGHSGATSPERPRRDVGRRNLRRRRSWSANPRHHDGAACRFVRHAQFHRR